MIRIDISRKIERPIEAVFARLADIDGYSSWMPRSSIFRQSRLWHPGTAGEQAFEERTILGTLRGRIVTSEPPRRIAFRQVLRVRGLVVFESRPRYVLTPLDHGTTLVRHQGVACLFGPLRVLEPFGRWLARRERTTTLETLKASLEGS